MRSPPRVTTSAVRAAARRSSRGPDVFVSGVVLAAGNSVRMRGGPGVGRGRGHGARNLGPAKQLLPYRGRTLLDAALDTARAAGFDQRIVTLGGSAAAVR